VSQGENMAAVTDPANPGELPGAEEATTGSAEEATTGSAEEATAGSAEPTPAPGPVADPGPAVAGPDEPSGDGSGSDDVTGTGPGDGEDGEDGGGSVEAAPERPRNLADLEHESEIAADYVEGLLDVADLDGDIDMDVEGDRALVSVVGATLSELVGRNGEVLEALQELTRLAVHRQTGVRTRIMLDVGGYRARRRTELTALGQEAAEDVSRTGVARRLDAMTPFERKIVHDAVAAAGLRSESEGEEPNRRVVVLPVG
jgi:spoIIIJ-associated protein